MKKRERETETVRNRERKRNKSEYEGRRESKKKQHVRHKMYKTLHGMKYHTQSQSTFTFCFINKYQPFSQRMILYQQHTIEPHGPAHTNTH